MTGTDKYIVGFEMDSMTNVLAFFPMIRFK